MTKRTLGSRKYALEDQLRFAELSGDYNPLHVDPIKARRTLFGEPVVHGLHNLLWAIDCYFQDRNRRSLPVLCLLGVSAQFSNPAFLTEVITVDLIEEASDKITLNILKGRVLLSAITLNLGENSACPQGPDNLPGSYNKKAQNKSLEELEGLTGKIEISYDGQSLFNDFPDALTVLGAGGVAKLLCLTRLVGMECPGLNSLFSGFNINLDPDEPAGHVGYRVTRADARVSIVQMAVDGGGLSGTVTAFYRPPPTDNIAMDAASRHISPDLCRGQRALIIGGSRGLGETATKLIAAGGGDVTITYAQGKKDAYRVCQEIESAGGACKSLAFDVTGSGHKLDGVAKHGEGPTHLYYFATPRITRRPSDGFDSAQFRMFLDFYADGFFKTYNACRRLTEAPLRIFYPSTVAIDGGMDGLAEYIQAKAAGEARCRQIEADDHKVRILIDRLPPLATDQTATLIQREIANPLEAMAKIVKNMTMV